MPSVHAESTDICRNTIKPSGRSTSQFSASSVERVSARFRLQVGMIPPCEPSFGTPHGFASLSGRRSSSRFALPCDLGATSRTIAGSLPRRARPPMKLIAYRLAGTEGCGLEPLPATREWMQQPGNPDLPHSQNELAPVAIVDRLGTPPIYKERHSVLQNRRRRAVRVDRGRPGPDRAGRRRLRCRRDARACVLLDRARRHLYGVWEVRIGDRDAGWRRRACRRGKSRQPRVRRAVADSGGGRGRDGERDDGGENGEDAGHG